MEPLSTLMLVASFLVAPAATSRPRWERNHNERNVIIPVVPPTTLDTAGEFTTQRLVLGTSSIAQEFTGLKAYPDRKNSLYERLAAFRPSDNQTTHTVLSKEVDINNAVCFVEKLPSGIPLPTLMRSDEGEIGLYWDTNEAYIDVNFDQDGTLSLYSRSREDGQEVFVENINITDLDATWAYENLSALATKYSMEA